MIIKAFITGLEIYGSYFPLKLNYKNNLTLIMN